MAIKKRNVKRISDTLPNIPVPLDPENALDFHTGQGELVGSGKALEFGSGFLYHGRDGLDEVILNNSICGKIPLTRVPHQWATGGFRNESKSPAIFVFSTKVFNKLMRDGKAKLNMTGMDPYPEIIVPIFIDDIEEIWISEDTYQRYESIAKNSESNSKGSLKPKLQKLFRMKKLKLIPELRHTMLESDTCFNIAFKCVGKYMISRNLFNQMPLFKERK